MLVEPAEPEFSRLYGAGEAQVIWTRLIADLETPVSAMLKLSSGRHNCFLLESVEGGAVRGRYSIIGIEPDLIFRAVGALFAVLFGRIARQFPRFQQGVLFQRVADECLDLQIGQRQQLDRLLQLRRHHQRLRLAQVEARREAHDWVSPVSCRRAVIATA